MFLESLCKVGKELGMIFICLLGNFLKFFEIYLRMGSLVKACSKVSNHVVTGSVGWCSQEGSSQVTPAAPTGLVGSRQ